MKFEEKLVRLRKSNGMSQEELAEKLGVSRQAVSRWELGSTLPDIPNLTQLSELFGVSADYLIHDDYESDNDIPKVKESSEIIHEKNKAHCIIFLRMQ
ncbi:MAG: helix-turn-helix transcriptional regulator [Lachnospiraceae bacterium]|nr:helix-turn-helix transcriptional regulator [Lachnospiraceae bacterium]